MIHRQHVAGAAHRLGGGSALPPTTCQPLNDWLTVDQSEERNERVNDLHAMHRPPPRRARLAFRGATRRCGRDIGCQKRVCGS
ncbi:hypothetical protein AAHC03_017124 [Spirometra sp. Aus1]